MRRSLSLTAVTAVGALTLLVGCGSSSSGGTGSDGSSGSTTNNSSAAPKTELSDGFHALTSGSALTTTFSLPTTSANLIKITGEKGDTPLTQAQADLISSAKITIETVAPDGKTLQQAAAAAASAPDGASTADLSITGSAGGTTYFSFLQVDKTLYLQVDLKGLLDAAGQGALFDGIKSQASALPPFASDFLDGKPVGLPLSAVTQLEDLLKGAAQGQGSGDIPDNSQIAKLVSQVEAAILNDLTVSRTTSGDTDSLAIKGNVRAIATDILSTISTAIPAAAAAIPSNAADQVPDKDIAATATVKGGAVSTLTFDFGQFSPHMADTLPLQAAFEKTGAPITAPTGATMVSFQDLIQFFTAADQGSSQSSTVVPKKSGRPARRH